MRKIVELNIQTLMHMSHLIMPQMVAKGRGLVINLSSAIAIKPIMLTVYASTKVRVNDWWDYCLAQNGENYGLFNYQN